MWPSGQLEVPAERVPRAPELAAASARDGAALAAEEVRRYLPNFVAPASGDCAVARKALVGRVLLLIGASFPSNCRLAKASRSRPRFSRSWADIWPAFAYFSRDHARGAALSSFKFYQQFKFA